MKRSLVTGATGFVGRALCKALLERGDEVVAFSLHGGTPAPTLSAQPLDLTSQGPLDPALMHNVDCVYHLAGIAHQRADFETYKAVNVGGTLALAEAANQAGVEQFVFLSSVKAMGGDHTHRVRAEADVSDISPDADPYGWSKQTAERQLQAGFMNDAMRIHIVRPALIYGPQAKGNLATLIRASRFSLGRPPQGGERSMIAVSDLVELLLQLELDERPGIHTWIATDHERYESRRLYDALRHAQGLETASVTLPSVLWRLACRMMDLRTGLANGATWEKLTGTELYSNQKLVEELRWNPKRQFEDVASSIIESGRTHGKNE